MDLLISEILDKVSKVKSKKEKVAWAICKIKDRCHKKVPNALSQFQEWCEQDPEAARIAAQRAGGVRRPVARPVQEGV